MLPVSHGLPQPASRASMMPLPWMSGPMLRLVHRAEKRSQAEPIRSFAIPSRSSSPHLSLTLGLTIMGLVACSTAAFGAFLVTGQFDSASGLALPAAAASTEPSAGPIRPAMAAHRLAGDGVSAVLAGEAVAPVREVGISASVAQPVGPAQAVVQEEANLGQEPSRDGAAAAKLSAPADPTGVLDASTSSLVGVWAANGKACSPDLARRRHLPVLINHQGAWAGETTCAFKTSKRAGNTWTFAAQCSDARKRWRSDVRVSVMGGRLTWTSQRGSQSYVRCHQGTLQAKRNQKSHPPV